MAEYLTDPDATMKLLTRLKEAAELAVVLEKEMQEIRNVASALALPWSQNMQALMAHLEIDLRYINAEIRDFLEK